MASYRPHKDNKDQDKPGVLQNKRIRSITKIVGHWDGYSEDPPRTIEDPIKKRDPLNPTHIICGKTPGHNASGGWLQKGAHYQDHDDPIGSTINGVRHDGRNFGEDNWYRWFLVLYSDKDQDEPVDPTIGENWVRYDMLYNVEGLLKDYYNPQNNMFDDYTERLTADGRLKTSKEIDQEKKAREETEKKNKNKNGSSQQSKNKSPRRKPPSRSRSAKKKKANDSPVGNGRSWLNDDED